MGLRVRFSHLKLCSLSECPRHGHRIETNRHTDSVLKDTLTQFKTYNLPRVGSSEVVVVRYCSELQFSSSQ